MTARQVIVEALAARMGEPMTPEAIATAVLATLAESGYAVVAVSPAAVVAAGGGAGVG